MSEFIDMLEGDLVAAAARRGLAPGRLSRWQRRRRALGSPLAIFGVLVAGSGAVATGATLLTDDDRAIRAPQAVAPEQSPVPASSRLVRPAVPDPTVGVPPWTLRLARSSTGLVCSTVGQLSAGRFGIIGTDNRFRTIEAGVADACSTARQNAATLVGVRTFAAGGAQESRSVLSGVAGRNLRSVRVTAAGRLHRLAVRAGGTFVGVFAGLPEDLGLRVRLQFADGHAESHPFGTAPNVLIDPAGGPAWQLRKISAGDDAPICVQLVPARETSRWSMTPAACGRLNGPMNNGTSLYFAIRRLDRKTLPARATSLPVHIRGMWDTEPRTVVWGAAGRDIASIQVTGPAGAAITQQRAGRSGAFAAMAGPSVTPDELTVTVRYRDGRRRTFRSSYRLEPWK